MDNAFIAVLVGIFTTAITGILSYLAAARKMSGQIKTTTAERLWEEAHDVRESLRFQLAERDSQAEERDERIDSMTAQVDDCKKDNNELREEVRLLHRENENLQVEINFVKKENEKLHEEVGVLTERVRVLTNGGTHA